MKTNKLTGFLCGMLMGCALLSCQHEAETVPNEEIIPLQVGNRWDYQVINYTSSSEVLDTTNYNRMVLKDTLIQNSKWYLLSDGYIVRNNSDGYVYYNSAGKQPVILYQNKDFGGIGYSYQYPTSSQYVLTTRTYELAPVPNSSFNFDAYLFKIEYQLTEPEFNKTTSSFQHDYVTPGVGLVRSDKFFDDARNIMRRYELKRYLVQ